ncbi:hypothetical protein C7387_0704 [Yokenella regensburgei]|uniref:Uncharacterized protein n=1 Tax=Yokenella regensburgei TaxID=158877 RepID=A0ABX9S144_9ENTR|nr:hypothetical protein [Yokenella regensburgei]RKR64026.1 hypothetical protein C7387_0704 [Yokenella regensburgei]VFS25688.1 Uncharacterised protein [Yokenella regensburgei]
MTSILIIWDLGDCEIYNTINPAALTLQLTHKLTQEVGEFAVEQISIVNRTKSLTENYNVVIDTSLTRINNKQVVTEIINSGLPPI